MSAESWQRRYWLNTLSNYARVVLRLGSGLLLFRLTFHHLDDAAFGFYALLWSLFGFTVLLDFGLGFTVQRALAQASARGNYAEASRFVATVFWSFAALAIVLAAVAWLGADRFIAQVNAPAAQVDEFRAALLIFAVFLALGLPTGLFGEMLRGLQRIDLFNALQIAGLLLNLGLVTWALLAGWSFRWVMLVSVASVVAPGIAAAPFVLRRAPGLSLHPRHFHLPSVRGVLSFSLVAYLVTFTNLLMARSDQAVIGFTLGVAAVALYQAGYKAAEMFNLFAVQLQDALSPAAARLHALGDRAALRHLLYANTRLTVALVVPLGALCAVYLEPLVRLLTGLPEVDRTTMLVGWTLIAATTSSLVTNSVAKRVLMMCGWERPLLAASVAEAGVNLFLSLILVRWFGVWGVALGTLAPAVVIGWTWILPLTARFAGTSVREFCREAFLPSLAPIIVAGLMLVALALWVPARADAGFLALGWRGLLLGGATIVTAWPLIRRLRHA